MLALNCALAVVTVNRRTRPHIRARTKRNRVRFITGLLMPRKWYFWLPLPTGQRPVRGRYLRINFFSFQRLWGEHAAAGRAGVFPPPGEIGTKLSDYQGHD